MNRNIWISSLLMPNQIWYALYIFIKCIVFLSELNCLCKRNVVNKNERKLKLNINFLKVFIFWWKLLDCKTPKYLLNNLNISIIFQQRLFRVVFHCHKLVSPSVSHSSPESLLWMCSVASIFGYFLCLSRRHFCPYDGIFDSERRQATDWSDKTRTGWIE